MAVKIDKGSALSSLSLTPLIDVVFLLLIFFLVTSRFEKEERELDIVLPEASEAMPLIAKPKELFVNVNESGQFYVGGSVRDSQSLLGLLEQAHANNPGRQKVIIRAHKKADFEFVAQAMNLCNRAGIRDYTVATK